MEWKFRDRLTSALVVVGLLDDLGQFERRFLSAPTEKSFQTWLEAKQLRYEQWLSRL